MDKRKTKKVPIKKFMNINLQEINTLLNENLKEKQTKNNNKNVRPTQTSFLKTIINLPTGTLKKILKKIGKPHKYLTYNEITEPFLKDLKKELKNYTNKKEQKQKQTKDYCEICTTKQNTKFKLYHKITLCTECYTQISQRLWKPKRYQ